jgi:lipopolysaccharide/colanic/teichoic acid biosynthesis glycosyltransferase
MLNRLLDILISFIGCCFLLLLLPLLAILIKLDSSGPIFYQADRIGKDGKPFKMYKFRTMYETSISVGASVCPQGDPRVTMMGLLLRRLKLNEFPQFFNVLKGDMTLVGPRPEAPDLAAGYPPEARKIFSVKPGLVGPNQILGRNEEELYPQGVNPKDYYLKEILPRKLPVDLQYIEEKSLLKDLKYLFLGVWVTVVKALNWRHLTDNLSQLTMVLSDCLLCLLSFTIAHLIRLDAFSPAGYTQIFLQILPFAIITRVPILFYLGCYQALIRYFNLKDLKRVFQGVSLGSGILVVLFYFLGHAVLGYPRSVFIIDWLLLTIILIGIRVFINALHHRQDKKYSVEKRRALIWGAGEAGIWCLRYLKEISNPRYEIAGFIDEDPKIRHRVIDGFRVLGDSHHLEMLVKLHGVQEIFMTEPFVPASSMDRLQQQCNQMQIVLKRFLPRTVKEITVSLAPQLQQKLQPELSSF